MKKLWMKSAMASLLIGFLFTACTNDDQQIAPVEDGTDISLSSDDAYLDLELESVDLELDFATTSSSNGRTTKFNGPFGRCRVITIDEAAKTVEIDFGDGCEGRDGKVRQGKIISTFSGDIEAGVRTRTSTFEDFFVDGNQIEGIRTRSVTRNDEGQKVETVTMEDGKITFADGDVLTRNASWTRTTVRGETLAETEIILEGSASGTCNEVFYTVEITTPLLKKMACFAERIPFPVSGEKQITRGTATAIKNYGDGTCDNLATVTIDGETTEIELGKRCRCGKDNNSDE